MRKKNLVTAMMCAVCLSAATAVPMTVMAEETEVTAEAADTEAEESTEADSGENTEADSEESTEEAFVQLERPEYNAADYVELGEYKGLTVTKVPVTVSDEEILEQIRVNAGSDILEELEEGTVELGDIANIDYEGKLDGVAFDGGTAMGYDLEIGSHSFIDGFEDGLIGVTVGDTVDLPLTFPENYGNADLAGQDVIFTVTVHSVKRMPELTDEIIRTVTDGEYTELEAYRESVREKLLEGKLANEDIAVKSSLLSKVAEVSKVTEYPQEMVEYGVSNMVNYYNRMAEMYGMEFAEFLQLYMGMTEEVFNEEVELAVKQNLQAEMYLLAIAEAEALDLTEEEFAERCEDYANQYGYESAETLMADYDEATLRISALQDKVLEFLTEQATIVEAEAEEAQSDAEAETEVVTEAQPDAEAETEELTEAVSEAE